MSAHITARQAVGLDPLPKTARKYRTIKKVTRNYFGSEWSLIEYYDGDTLWVFRYNTDQEFSTPSSRNDGRF